MRPSALLLTLLALAGAAEEACEGGLPPPREASYVHADAALTAAKLRPLLPQGVTVEDMTLREGASVAEARRIFDEYGALIVRQLAAAHAPSIRAAADLAFSRSLALLAAGQVEPVENTHDGHTHTIGWVSPDQTLFIPAPRGHVREVQAMVLSVDYASDASMLHAATDARTLDIVEALLSK